MNNTKDNTNNNKTKPEMEIKMMENEEEMNHVKNPLHNENVNILYILHYMDCLCFLLQWFNWQV